MGISNVGGGGASYAGALYPRRAETDSPTTTTPASPTTTSAPTTSAPTTTPPTTPPPTTPPPTTSPPTTTTPPTTPDAYTQTDDAYADSSSGRDHLHSEAFGDAAGQRDVFAGHCVGLSVALMNRVGSGQAPDLMGAGQRLRQQLSDPASRAATTRDLHFRQYLNQDGLVETVAGYYWRRGNYGLNGAGLIDDLRNNFSSRYETDDGRGTLQNDFAHVGLTLRSGWAHSVLIQRVNPSDDYRRDQYQLYDSNHGTFRYENFENLAGALTRLYNNGYQGAGQGVGAAYTSYYAGERSWQPHAADAAQDRFSPLLDAWLGDVVDAPGAQPGQPAVARLDGLAPLPDLDNAELDRYLSASPGGSGHDETKRSADTRDERHPFALFKPSTLAPDQLKQNKGFFADRTSLGNVNLDLHDFNLKAEPGAVDGAGYLGTFRERNAATDRLTGNGAKNGYLYFVAPSPNMVDVAGSLGRTHARDATNGEVAAMGSIDYSQIRGWQKVTDGKAGEYVANPDYRWDVYDQTRTAGAQPQLAHFAATDPAWSDADHRAYVNPVQRDGNTVYRPKEAAGLSEARFAAQARAKVRQLADAQANGDDYRGPVQLKPLWNNAQGTGSTRLEFYNAGSPSGYPSIDSSQAAGVDASLRMGDDGRIHLASDYSKVIRIDNNGNAVIGAIPTDPDNVNGVFGYDKTTGGLQHQEDGKWLTEGISAYQPFVSVAPRSDGLLARQKWRIEDMAGRPVRPPAPASLFKGSTAGSTDQLHRFYADPDSALPKDATRFVTSIDGVTGPASNRFLDYADHIGWRDARNAIDWMNSHNAAWLFKDGYYAVPDGPDGMEVRTLGGVPAWHMLLGATEADDTYGILGAGLQSDFTVPEVTWQKVSEGQRRDGRLQALVTQKFM